MVLASTPHRRVLPRGECSDVIPDELPVFAESFVTIRITVFQ